MIACICFGILEIGLISAIVAGFAALLRRLRGRKDCCKHECTD